MKKFFMKFLDIRVLSLIFAILIWYYVIGVQGPTVTRTFKVPITPINIGSGVYITNELPDVTVTAEGSSKVILGIKGNDFTALVNLAGKSEGEFYLPIDVKPPTSAIKVKSVSPEKVKVALEKITTRKMPVIVKFKGNPAPNFLPKEPVVTPSSVMLTGPLSKLNEIKSVVVEVDLTGINSETTLVLPVQLVIKDNADVSNVQINPASCVVKILENNPNISKTLPVVPKINGEPFQGFGIKGISVSPQTITVSGDMKTLSSLQFIETEPIDVSGITKTKTFKVALNVPEGVKINGDNACSVKVNVEPVKTLEITVPLTVNYNAVLFDATISAKEVKVILKGFADTLDKIDKQSITAIVDVSTFGEGTYTVPVIIKGLPENTVISIVSPETVEITLKKKGGNE